MILVDYSQLAIASYAVLAHGSEDEKVIDLNLVRHAILDSIRKINSRFKNEYGEIVLCIDDNKSWRREIFPYYKANRAEARKKSKLNIKDLMFCIKQIKEELKDFFPYKVIEVKNSEADDIIGVLTRFGISKEERILIVSRDKDFIQLQQNTHLVDQYDKVNDKFLSFPDPDKFLFDHIIGGDSGDGIPNILSKGDSFVTKTRQKPLTKKKLASFWEDKKQLLEYKDRLIENRRLIDLEFTPDDIKCEILNQYNNYAINKRSDLYQYFMDKGLNKLYDNIGEF